MKRTHKRRKRRQANMALRSRAGVLSTSPLLEELQAYYIEKGEKREAIVAMMPAIDVEVIHRAD